MSETRRFMDGSIVTREQAEAEGHDWNIVRLYTDPVLEPQPVTEQSQTWLAVIHRKTVGGVDKIVGPFATEERAMHWLESMQKPGSVHQLVVLS